MGMKEAGENGGGGGGCRSRREKGETGWLQGGGRGREEVDRAEGGGQAGRGAVVKRDRITPHNLPASWKLWR